MTAFTPSMSLPLQAQAPPTAVQPMTAPSVADADAEARRLSSGVARGDELVFRELYDRFHHRVFRLALVIGRGDVSLAHDTVQSVFLTAASSLRAVDTESHLWNWLARVARQQIGKVWRQRGRDSAIVSMSELPEPHSIPESDSDLDEKLDAALLALDAEDKQLIEWFYFDGLSHKAIAQRLEATPKAISSRLERARAKLRASLATVS